MIEAASWESSADVKAIHMTAEWSRDICVCYFIIGDILVMQVRVTSANK